MPADMVKRFHTAVQQTLALDEFKAKLAEQGYDQWSGTPQTLSERAAREVEAERREDERSGERVERRVHGNPVQRGAKEAE